MMTWRVRIDSLSPLERNGRDCFGFFELHGKRRAMMRSAMATRDGTQCFLIAPHAYQRFMQDEVGANPNPNPSPNPNPACQRFMQDEVCRCVEG